MQPIASTITAGGPTTFCAGGNVVLSGNVGGTWSNGATTATITVTASGNYSVSNSSACGNATSNHIVVTVNPAVVASVITAGSATTFCTGGSVILSGNVGGTWSNGATTASTTITTSGDYSVTNTNSCGTVTSNHVVVTVNPTATASVITAGSAITFCTGGSVILSGNVGGTWSNGAATATTTITTSGNYSVTNTNGCGSVTSNHIIVTVNAPVVASVITAGSATTFCAGANVVLSGNVGGTWSNGAITATTTITTSGNYYVTNTNSCGTVTSNHIVVTVNPTATVSTITAGSAITFCAGGNVVLSGNIGGTWSNGATTATITVTVTTAGNYSVSNTNGCGTVTSNHIVVTVNPQPIASVITAGGATTFCAGGSVILSGNVGGTWSNSATTATITVTTPGDYYVTNTNGCGTVTSNHIAVTINPLPIASVITAGGATTFCVGGNVVLSGNVGGTWSNGATTAAITVTTAGNYSVTNTNGCGTVTSNHIVVTTNPALTAAVITAGGATSLCAGGSVILSGNVGGIWSNGATTATITVSATGDYSVTKTNACGTVTSNHIAVTLNASPLALAGSDITICNGNSITLGGSAILGHTYSWTPTAGLSSATISNPVATPSATTTYVLTETITASGCKASNSVKVTISGAPTISTSVCIGGAVSFSATAFGVDVTYQWRKGTVNLTNGGNISGATSSSLIISPVNLIDASSNYNVVVTGACSVSATPLTASLVVFDAPIIVTQPVSQTPCAGTSTSFSVAAAGLGLTYQWRIGAVNVTNGADISGATSAKLTINNVNSSDIAANYNVVITGACSTVKSTSSNASLVLCAVTSLAPANMNGEIQVVNIYPNPSKASINIDIIDPTKIQNAELKLYDIVGSVVINTALTSKLTTLDTRNYPTGIYFYKVLDNDKIIQTGKLIFEK